MAVLTASWWMLRMAELRLVLSSGSLARYCWMSGLNWPIRVRRRTGRSEIFTEPAGHLGVCGRADGRDVAVDGMLWRTAGKSACYAGELVVPEPVDAVQ